MVNNSEKFKHLDPELAWKNKNSLLVEYTYMCTAYSIQPCQIEFNPVSKTWIPFIYLSCVDNSPHKRLESNQPGMRISNFISNIVYSLIIQNWLEVSLKYRILYWVSSEPGDQTILLPINNKTELLRWWDGPSWHLLA